MWAHKGHLTDDRPTFSPGFRREDGSTRNDTSRDENAEDEIRNGTDDNGQLDAEDLSSDVEVPFKFRSKGSS